MYDGNMTPWDTLKFPGEIFVNFSENSKVLFIVSIIRLCRLYLKSDFLSSYIQKKIICQIYNRAMANQLRVWQHDRRVFPSYVVILEPHTQFRLR